MNNAGSTSYSSLVNPLIIHQIAECWLRELHVDHWLKEEKWIIIFERKENEGSKQSNI
jgi:hypothetical protein